MSQPTANRAMAEDQSGSDSAFHAPRLHLLLLLLIVCAAFVLRLYHLDAQSFWSDEGISVIRARHDLPELLASLPVEHVPLYFVGLHVWMQLTGEGDFAVRYFSLFFSVLALPVIYQLGAVIGRAVFKAPDSADSLRARAVGLTSVALAGINPLQVWYAQEARMYSLLVVLCAGAAFCLLRAYGPYLEAPLGAGSVRPARSGLRYWLGFALLCAAALYTHFFAALAVAAFGIWALGAVLLEYSRDEASRLAHGGAEGLCPAASRDEASRLAHGGAEHLGSSARRGAPARSRLWWPLIGSFALIALLFGPWLPRAIEALSFPGWQVAAEPLMLPGRYLVAYTLGTTVADEWRWAALGFLILLAAGAAILARSRSMVAWLPLCYVFIPFLLLMLLALRKPGYHERYLIVITPLSFVILAVALYALRMSSRIRHVSFAGGRLASCARAVRAARGIRPAAQDIVVRAAMQTRSGGVAGETRGLLLAGAPVGRVLSITVVLLAVAVSGLSLYNLYFDAGYAKPDFRAAAQYIDLLDRQGDGLIFDGPDPNKAFYRYFSRRKVAAFDSTDFDTQDAGEIDAFLKNEAPKRDRWWVVLYFHPAGPTEDWLARFGYQTSSRWFNGIRVLLYSTPMDASLVELMPQSVETSLPLQIGGVRTLPVVHAGEVLPVVVRWQPSGALPADFQASMRLVDGEGATIQHIDRRPLDGRIPTSQWQPGTSIEDRYGLLLPADAPAGHYRIEIILYRLSGGDVFHALGPGFEVKP
jgi:hypothetical protein